jgi:hypothetical protein
MCRWKNDIKMDLKEIGCKWKECSWLVQEKVAKWAFKIMNLKFHRKLGIIWPSE